MRPGVTRPLALCAAVTAGLLLFVCPRGAVLPEDLAGPGGTFMRVDGLAVHYRHAPGPGDRTFILLHGFGASTFSWRMVEEPLSDLGHTISYDRPGFGLTSRPREIGEGEPDPYGHLAGVELLSAVIDTTGARAVILVAHSAGARIALDYAVNRPEEVEALVLIAPAAGGDAKRSVPGFARGNALRRLGPYMLRPLSYVLPRSLDRAWHDPGLITPEMREGYTLPLKVAGWDVGLWGVLVSDRPDGGPAAAVYPPTLVIAGSQDSITPPDEAEALARAIGAEFVSIDLCGHLPHEERPDEVMDAIREFVAGLGDRDPPPGHGDGGVSPHERRCAMLEFYCVST